MSECFTIHNAMQIAFSDKSVSHAVPSVFRWLKYERYCCPSSHPNLVTLLYAEVPKAKMSFFCPQ